MWKNYQVLRLLLNVLAPALILTIVVMASGCGELPADDSRLSAQAQSQATTRAFDAVPAYIPSGYPAREDINWYLQQTERRDVWYIYALSMTGEPLFYVVSDMKPRNICISITAPDRKDRSGTSSSYNTVVRSAPALDGVYYGGALCNAYYMRDATTGGFIELAGDTFTLVSSRAPLFLETDVQRLQPEE